MVTGRQYADKVLEAYKCNGGYIWGQSGDIWTVEKQASLVKKYNSNPSKYSNYELAAKYGEKWIGHRVWDCSGLTSWAGKQLGMSFYHGSNSSWNKDCQKKGKMTRGLKLPVGAWVYTGTDDSKPHSGTVTADGVVTEAQGTKTGVVQTKLTNSKWKYWGLAKGIKFDFIPGQESTVVTAPAQTVEPIQPSKPTTVKHLTLRRGARGEEVRYMQTLLHNAGSGLEIDGIFGIGTLSAVKSFQSRHGLVVDGIVGPKTWAELLKYDKK